MSLVSWILITSVLGFIIGWLLVWKIFQKKFITSSEDWNNKNNKSKLGIKKLKKNKKRLEIHLLASHKKIQILEEEKNNVLESSKARAIMFKDIIDELKDKNELSTTKLTKLSQSYEVLEREALTQKDLGTQTIQLKSSHNKILQDLATFKETKRDEIEAIRSETQEIMCDHEQKISDLSVKLDEKNRELHALKQSNADLTTDNQMLDTDLKNITEQYRAMSDDFSEFKLEAKDNENQAKVILNKAKAELDHLNNKQQDKENVTSHVTQKDNPVDTKTNLRTIQPKAAQKIASVSDQQSSKNTQSKPAPKKASVLVLKTDKSQIDDLKQIKGVGMVLEQRLNKQGIYRFDQLAVLTKTEIQKIDKELNFKGRIERDDWVNQAQKLIKQKKAK